MDFNLAKIKLCLTQGQIKALFHRERSSKEDRMGTVLNAILVPTIGLLIIFFFILLYNTIILNDNYDYAHTIGFAFVISAFVLLFVLARRGYVQQAAYGLIALCFLGSFYCGYRWGDSLPETLLCFAVTMGITNLLFGMRTSIVVMLISFTAVFYLSSHEMNHPEILSWQNDGLDFIDFIAYFGIIAFMFGLSWISRWKIEKSLARAESSEKILEQERNLLEKRISERTEELKRSQEKHISELASIAEFGRLSQGLFHDLVSPISSMLLQIEKLSELPSKKEIREGKESLQKMCSATKRFSGYFASLRLAIGGNRVGMDCSFEEELGHVFNLLAFNARAQTVSYDKPELEIGRIPFGPADIHQILFNLIANAIDSYESIRDNRKRVVSVKAKTEKIETSRENLSIIISDNGTGISPKDLQHIFEQFFTTKEACQGLGIGLSTVKRIIDDLGGTISVESEVGKGTRFEVVLPIPPRPTQNKPCT